MKKVLIAALVSALPAAAMADVVIYGKMAAGLESVDNGQSTQTKVEDQFSRIGFKGAEDLGNGLKAIWQVETGFGIDGDSRGGSGSGTFANRQSFVGLSSEFGKLRLGNLSNFGDSDMGTIDPWEYRSDSLGLGLFTRDNGRVKNAVRYDMPEIAGFNAALLYGTKEDKKTGLVDFDNVQFANGNTDREIYNLGLGYEYAGYFAKYSYTYETPVTLESVKGKDSQKNMLEVGYEANNLFVGAGFKQNSGDYSTTIFGSDLFSAVDAADLPAAHGKKLKTTEFALTGAYTWGNLTGKATYAQGEDLKIDGAKQSETGYKQFVVGADYALSKRTIVGAQYGQLKFDTNAAAVYGLPAGEDTLNSVGVNLVHRF